MKPEGGDVSKNGGVRSLREKRATRTKNRKQKTHCVISPLIRIDCELGGIPSHALISLDHCEASDKCGLRRR